MRSIFFDRNFSVFKQLKMSSKYYLDRYPLNPVMTAYLKNYVNNLQVDKDIPSKSLKKYSSRRKGWVYL